MNDLDGGRLVVVGTGIRSIGQLTLEAVSWIRAADVVCHAVSDPLTKRWIIDNATVAHDLTSFYEEGVFRRTTYRRTAEHVVSHVRDGLLVVLASYGHPGTFDESSHLAIKMARDEGYPATMLAAVSATDCLFADLGIDPGEGTCETYEATDMLIRSRVPRPDSHVIVWQIGFVANIGFSRGPTSGNVEALRDYLLKFYPATHEVTYYQGPQYATCPPVTLTVQLADLASVPKVDASTLYVPPSRTRAIDAEVVSGLGLNVLLEGQQHAEGTAESASVLALDADPRPSPRSRVAEILTVLTEQPHELIAYVRDPRAYLDGTDLDTIEKWAVLSNNQRAIPACITSGDGYRAAVELGIADSQEQAESYSISADGKLMRPRG